MPSLRINKKRKYYLDIARIITFPIYIILYSVTFCCHALEGLPIQTPCKYFKEYCIVRREQYD